MIKNKSVLLLSFLGILDTIYLSLPHLSNVKTYCETSGEFSCDIVLYSKYSEMFGIPNAFLGVIFYIFLFLVFIYWDKLKIKVENLIKIIIFILAIASSFYIYLIYLQKYVIGSFCPYCLLSAFITFLILIILLNKYFKEK